MSESVDKCGSGCLPNVVDYSTTNSRGEGESPTPQDTSINDSSFSSGALTLTSVKAPTYVNSNLHNPKGVEGSNPPPLY
ncbi:hypothetical protein ES705_47347 [subsurface metagenome]